MKIKGLLLFLTIFVLMIPILNYENELINVQLENRSNEMAGYSEAYTPHDSIIIHSNEELLSLGLPGDGSKNNPFIFQNLEIIGSMYGIFVENITYSISILNCNFDQIGFAISLDDMFSSDVEISGNKQSLCMYNIGWVFKHLNFWFRVFQLKARNLSN